MAKVCERGCGKTIQWEGKTLIEGSTGFFEVGTDIEHTFARCDKLKEFEADHFEDDLDIDEDTDDDEDEDVKDDD